MKRKLLVGLAMAGSMVLLLSGCSAAKRTVEFDDAAAAKEAMDNATVIAMEGNLVNVNQTSNIWADGKVAGYMDVKGFWDTKWSITVDGELWFYMKYVTDEPINDVEGVFTGSTYGFYDSDDTCLGYAQKRSIQTADGYSDDYLVFLDGEGNETGYYAEEDGTAMYDEDANVIATGTSSLHFFSEKCDFNIEMQEGYYDVQVDFMYKLAMYLMLYDDENQSYLDR